MISLFFLYVFITQQYRSVTVPPSPSPPMVQKVVQVPKPVKDVTGVTTGGQTHEFAVVSWYGQSNCSQPSCLTASGEVFNENNYTFACLPPMEFGTRVTFYFNGKTKEAYCTDRGGFKKYQRTFDFSKILFAHFAPVEQGIINNMEWKVIK